MLELSRSEILAQKADDSQPSSNALVREGQLLWQGISSAPEFLKSSFDEDKRAHTIQTALMSAGITLALTCLKRSPGLGWTAGRVVGPALAVPMLSDINGRVLDMSSAVADNWNSDRNWKQNVQTAKENIGQFTADFAISALASGAAEKFGRSYFGLQTPGVHKLPELNKESIMSNWQKHMDGEIVPYKMYSAEGGGMRQVDLYLPKNAQFASEAAATGAKGTGLLIAQDGLKLDFGKLKNLELPDTGLVNLRSDKSADYVAAYTHPHRFRIVPGANLAAWRHESGLIKEGGWLAPKAGYSDVAYVTDVNNLLTNMFKTERTVLAGFSSGAIVSNEVAAKLGPARIHSVISGASTVTGTEPAAVAGQFKLFIRDHGDPTLLQNGGAGGKAQIMANLGHRQVLQSMPEKQMAYALAAYEGQPLLSRKVEHPTVSIEHVALPDGTPVVAQIKTSNNKHSFMTIDPEAATTKNLAPHVQEQLNLHSIVKDIVNGNLSRFAIQ